MWQISAISAVNIVFAANITHNHRKECGEYAIHTRKAGLA